MADQGFIGGIVANGVSLPEKAVDMGDGTYARVVTSSAADKATASGAYRRSAAVSSTPGQGVLITGVTTAGTANFTLAGGGALVVNVPLGSTILPLAITAASLGTAVGGTFQSLFIT